LSVEKHVCTKHLPWHPSSVSVRDGIVTMTNETYQRLSVTQILRNSLLSHDGICNTFEVLSLTYPIGTLCVVIFLLALTPSQWNPHWNCFHSIEYCMVLRQVVMLRFLPTVFVWWTLFLACMLTGRFNNTRN